MCCAADANVDFQETVGLVAGLRRRGVEAELLVVPDERHGFVRWASQLLAAQATADFLVSHLM